MLESYSHDCSSFVTLTYNSKYIPRYDLYGTTLRPSDVQTFMKRLREAVTPDKVRFYLCGEYGDNNLRPHYHLALFNYPPCFYGRPESHPLYNPRKAFQCDCPSCSIVHKAWTHRNESKGKTHVGELNEDSASYVAQYVTKFKSKKSDLPDERMHPEFARMSNRPGIGAPAINIISNALDNEFAQHDLQLTGDVPDVLKHGKKTLPLGRYLKSKLRLAKGMEEQCPDHILEKIKQELKTEKQMYYSQFNKAPRLLQTMENFLHHKNKQLILNKETRFKIYSKGNSI